VLWFLLWLVLVLAAAAFLAYLGRHLWRKAKALTTELGAASDRLGEIAAVISESSSPPSTRWSDLR
jgi:threonine/homoserine/homoserine lactone efflux protein